MVVALSAVALPDVNGAVVVIEDLSELVSAQRAAAWQEVARRMAHEIKNPLTPIQLSAERIAKRFKSETNSNPGNDSENRTSVIIKEGTETILREVSALKSMVDEFSRYARLPDADKQVVDPHEIIRLASSLYEDRISKTEIQLHLDEEVPQILADVEQMKRVFVNLIDNSIESFPNDEDSKTITIKTIFEKQREIVRIEVSDNGSGIDPADLQKLFQPYFSTKGRGTGLGLAIVNRIILDHHGKITAAVNKPRGSKFTIELPVQNG